MKRWLFTIETVSQKKNNHHQLKLLEKRIVSKRVNPQQSFENKNGIST